MVQAGIRRPDHSVSSELSSSFEALIEDLSKGGLPLSWLSRRGQWTSVGNLFFDAQNQIVSKSAVNVTMSFASTLSLLLYLISKVKLKNVEVSPGLLLMPEIIDSVESFPAHCLIFAWNGS
jgi:hypothetical protein